MLTRIVCPVLGCALLAGLAVAQAPPREDPTRAEVDGLRARAQALLAQALELEAQARQARADREAAERYMRAFAESCLDALLKGDAEALLPVMTQQLKEKFLVDKGNVQARQSLDVIRRQGISVSGYKIADATTAPGSEEALFRAEITGKSTAPDDHGKGRAATVTLRIQKENGRYVLGFLSAVIVK